LVPSQVSQELLRVLPLNAFVLVAFAFQPFSYVDGRPPKNTKRIRLNAWTVKSRMVEFSISLERVWTVPREPPVRFAAVSVPPLAVPIHPRRKRRGSAGRRRVSLHAPGST
jgi:hypothetical protein